MSLSSLSWENLPPFFFRPRLAKTRNQSQLVLGMLKQRLADRVFVVLVTDFFSLIEFPSQASTLLFSLSDKLLQKSGATASAQPRIPGQV